jgi:hypothetical protein
LEGGPEQGVGGANNPGSKTRMLLSGNNMLIPKEEVQYRKLSYQKMNNHGNHMGYIGGPLGHHSNN